MDKNYVIFDMDGTMLESMKQWRRLMQDYAEGIGLEWTEQISTDVDELSVSEAARYFVDQHAHRPCSRALQ